MATGEGEATELRGAVSPISTEPQAKIPKYMLLPLLFAVSACTLVCLHPVLRAHAHATPSWLHQAGSDITKHYMVSMHWCSVSQPRIPSYMAYAVRGPASSQVPKPSKEPMCEYSYAVAPVQTSVYKRNRPEMPPSSFARLFALLFYRDDSSQQVWPR